MRECISWVEIIPLNFSFGKLAFAFDVNVAGLVWEMSLFHAFSSFMHVITTVVNFFSTLVTVRKVVVTLAPRPYVLPVLCTNTIRSEIEPLLFTHRSHNGSDKLEPRITISILDSPIHRTDLTGYRMNPLGSLSLTLLLLFVVSSTALTLSQNASYWMDIILGIALLIQRDVTLFSPSSFAKTTDLAIHQSRLNLYVLKEMLENVLIDDTTFVENLADLAVNVFPFLPYGLANESVERVKVFTELFVNVIATFTIFHRDSERKTILVRLFVYGSTSSEIVVAMTTFSLTEQFV
jgi:hypothetical protein